jgi:predicted Zn-ribbon and HTH transcriptional regulator
MPVTLAVPQLSCERCGHKWYPRKAVYPKRCARCRTPYWNKPRVNRTRRKAAVS